MTRFGGQEIRGEIKARRNRMREGWGACAAYYVYMQLYVVEHVSLLMSLAGASTQGMEHKGVGDTDTKQESDDKLVKQKYVFSVRSTLFTMLDPISMFLICVCHKVKPRYTGISEFSVISHATHSHTTL